MKPGNPFLNIRLRMERRQEFIRLCESQGSNASNEVRVFIDRMLDNGTLDPARLVAIAKEQAQA